LKKEGKTILLVEQNAYAALEVADRAYVLETGTLKLSGTTIELLQNEAVKNAYLGG
jgi:branched-chain amino acid transport system ATP-binding protein